MSFFKRLSFQKILAILIDCPCLPLYQLVGLFSSCRTIKLDNVDDFTLSKIFDKYQSDKSILHSYDFAYTRIFKNRRYEYLNILEIGIGSNDISMPFNMGSNGSVGASLYSWREYFTNFFIYGADIDPACLFDAPRIQTSLCNQLQFKSIQNMATLFSRRRGQNFLIYAMMTDIIPFGANRRTFLALRPYLKNKYQYVVEDVSPWIELAWKGFAHIHSVAV